MPLVFAQCQKVYLIFLGWVTQAVFRDYGWFDLKGFKISKIAFLAQFVSTYSRKTATHPKKIGEIGKQYLHLYLPVEIELDWEN